MVQRLARAGRKFWNFIRPRRKWGLVSFFIFAAIILCVYFFGGSSASAQIADAEKYGNNLLIKLFTDLAIWIAGFFIQATVFIMDFVIEIAAYNNFINSDAVLFGWTLVRDIANMFFVVILLIIAFGTVLGAETYSWKKLLVKFVLAAVLVNFSRVICGVLIDAAQVFMITFLNGVAAVAGGNIVNAFKLTDVLSFDPKTAADQFTDVGILGTAIASMFFAVIAAFTIGAYFVVLVGRLITLWILIILSPLAFVLNVIPKTQSYAGQWWSEFTNNLISGPILAFFLWLAFAVVGDGLPHDELATGNPFPLDTTPEQVSGSASTNNVMGGLGAVMEWGNLANFIIAVGMLLAGVKATQKLGVIGSGMLGSAVEMGKKVATVATGIAAGRWLAQKGVQGAKAGIKMAAMNVPFVGGKSWQRRGRNIAGWTNARVVQPIQYAREQAAKKLEKKGLLGKLAAGVIETDLKKEEASKQWGKLAATKQEARMEDMGLGAREVGKENLKEKARVDALKAQGGMAKDRWYNKAMTEFYGAPKELQNMQAERGGLVARESAEQAIIQDASLEITNAQAELEKSKDNPDKVAELKATIAQNTAAKEGAEQNLAQIMNVKQNLDKKIDGVFKDDSKWNEKSLIGRDIIQNKVEKDRNISDLAAAQGMVELSYLATDEGKKAQANAAEAKIMQQQMGETVNAQKQLTELKKIEELLKKQPAEGPERNALALRYQSLQQDMYSSKAGGEQLRLDQSHESDKKLAMARDEKLKESGRLPAYLSQVLQKHAKEEIDLKSAKTFDQMMANIEFLSSQMGKEADPVKRDIMQKEKTDWLMAAGNRGSDTGLAALLKATKNKNVDASNVDSVRAAHLSAHLDEEVEQTAEGVNKALKKMKDKLGENFDPFMANHVNSLSMMADGGAVAHGGLYKMVTDKNTGRQTYQPTNQETDANLIRDKRKYHWSQARQAGRGFDGAMDYEGGKYKVNSDVAVEHVVNLVGNRTSVGYANMHEMNINSLGKAIENTDNKEFLDKLIHDLKGSITDEKAWDVLVQRISKSNKAAFEKVVARYPKSAEKK